MKKLTMITLVLLLTISLMACGNGVDEAVDEPQESGIEDVREAAEGGESVTVDPPQKVVDEQKEEPKPKEEPKEEPKTTTTTETQTETEAETIEPEPKPAPEPEPDPEPEFVNKYANLSLKNVLVAMIDNKAYFGEWLFVTNADVRLSGTETTEGIVCFTDKERDSNEAKLKEADAEYTLSSIYVDSLFYEIVKGKTFGSRTDVILYIESHIYHKAFEPQNWQDWHRDCPYYYKNFEG